MSLCSDPDDMCADERLEEVASILARGILRLHGRIVGDFDDPENLADDAPTCLDLPRGSRPDRPTG